MLSVPVPDLTQNRALHRDVESYVIDLIRNGALGPGDRVNEAEIARRLQISRTPVREAFARLIKDGLLEHVPRRGVFVAQLSRESVEEITSLRAVIEGFAARRACSRASQEELSRLGEIIMEGVEAGRQGDWLTMEEKNAEFHDTLIEIAHHGLLSRVWRTLTPTTWKVTPGTRPEPFTLDQVDDFSVRHQRLHAAIASGDPDQAEREAVAHVDRARSKLLGPEPPQT